MMILNFMKYTEEIRESESENGSQIPKWPNFSRFLGFNYD